MSDSLLTSLHKLLATPEPASLGPQPRAGRESLSALNARLDEVFTSGDLSSSAEKLIRSLVLLWHDHLEPSHSLSQEIHSKDGSYVHGIMHRREPDYGNARYWFHRVGEHPCYRVLGERVESLDGATARDLIARLAPKGKLDPFALIELCEATAGEGEHSAKAALLRDVQKIEFETLLDYFARQ
jgi:hypothetical protein